MMLDEWMSRLGGGASRAGGKKTSKAREWRAFDYSLSVQTWGFWMSSVFQIRENPARGRQPSEGAVMLQTGDRGFGGDSCGLCQISAKARQFGPVCVADGCGGR